MIFAALALSAAAHAAGLSTNILHPTGVKDASISSATVMCPGTGRFSLTVEQLGAGVRVRDAVAYGKPLKSAALESMNRWLIGKRSFETIEISCIGLQAAAYIALNVRDGERFKPVNLRLAMEKGAPSMTVEERQFPD